jgi:hypothetical protein
MAVIANHEGKAMAALKRSNFNESALSKGTGWNSYINKSGPRMENTAVN